MHPDQTQGRGMETGKADPAQPGGGEDIGDECEGRDSREDIGRQAEQRPAQEQGSQGGGGKLTL